LKKTRQCLGQQRLAGARRAQQENVTLLQLDISGYHLAVDAFVMVMDRNGKNFLCSFLTDNVLIENAFDLGRFGHVRRRGQILIVIDFFGNYIIAQIDAFIADVDGWASDKLPDLILALSAKRADEIP
jgi:hypothetical protein